MFRKSKVYIALVLVLALLVSTCSAATYTVKKGDNLWNLAIKFFGSGLDYTKIMDANPSIKDPNLIYIDQVLTIPGKEISADDAIVGVKAIGFVDNDGAKISAIAVEYGVDLDGAEVDLDDFEVGNYGMTQSTKCELGSDPGKPTKVYVNDKPEISAEGGSGTGKYVIIEVNTDYQLGSITSYRVTLCADVLQTGTIQTNDHIILPGTEKATNYMTTEIKYGSMSITTNFANEGAYTIEGVDVFEMHTKEAGTAFHAVNCFEEATGEYTDVDMPYALYVPEDYNASKEYALVVHINDAGCLGSDPMNSLARSRGPLNFTTDEVQQLAKDQGLGGVIVLVPQIEMNLRSTRDNWSVSAAVPATWQLMDYITEAYSIDMNRIYGTGQSMGGMQIVAMAAQRDNYFAGIWQNGCQWGSNYNLSDDGYDGQVYYAAPADGEIIWTVDADGNEVDYRNWYYMISDDNILITNCVGDTFSSGAWQELAYLYSDLAGVEIPKVTWNPLTLSKEEQSEVMNQFLAEATKTNETGFYWTALEGGNHQATWVYSHGVFANYEWLLSQTRESEMEREKLDLDKPFVRAQEQIQTEERFIGQDIAGNDVYYVTGEAGSGTAGYNSTLYGQSGATIVKGAGWTVTGD